MLNKEEGRIFFYVLKEILYEILSLEASIQGEKIVTNNLQLDRVKLLLNEVLLKVLHYVNHLCFFYLLYV
jgi:hypothetical protein